MFAIYGTTYGAGNGSTTFNLPDFRNRTIWGAEDFGYIEAGLPDHNHKVTIGTRKGSGVDNYYDDYDAGSQVTFNTGLASASNSIYGKSNTVQPPAIKVRVVTRYK